MLKMIIFFTINLYGYFGLSREGRGQFKKVPRFVVPSDSEASLNLFWTASYGESSRLAARSDILYPVVPSDSKASKGKRGVSSACALGERRGVSLHKNIFLNSLKEGRRGFLTIMDLWII